MLPAWGPPALSEEVSPRCLLSQEVCGSLSSVHLQDHCLEGRQTSHQRCLESNLLAKKGARKILRNMFIVFAFLISLVDDNIWKYLQFLFKLDHSLIELETPEKVELQIASSMPSLYLIVA